MIPGEFCFDGFVLPDLEGVEDFSWVQDLVGV